MNSFDNQSNLDQQVIFGEDVRSKMMVGLDLLADAVSSTLGPRGRNVIIYRPGGKAHLTKDGVTVAAAINPTDPVERMAVTIVKDVSKQACNEAGDGTTTATVLARAIARKAMAEVNTNTSPVLMQRGIQYAADLLQEQLKANATPCTEREQMVRVATISANGDESIGKLVGEAVFDAGKYGHVIVEPSRADTDRLEVTSGLRQENGWYGPAFINDQTKQTLELKNTKVLLIDGTLDSLAPYNTIITDIANSKNGTLLISAEKFDDLVISKIVAINTTIKRKAIAVVKSSGYSLRRKDMLRDLAAYVGGIVTGAEGEIPPEEFNATMLGHADEVVLERKSGVIISTNGDADKIANRINVIKDQLDGNELSPFERTKLQERLGLLSGGVAKIFVGAATEVEMIERKDRFDDAVCAVRSACDMGVLPGGGTALLVARAQLDEKENLDGRELDFTVGYNVVMEAIAAPLKAISSNAGVDSDETFRTVYVQIEADVRKKGVSAFGYNAATGSFGDMLQMNVLDPAKVTCSAIKYAASIAGSLVTTEVGIVG